jgi:hypothetical protein
MVAIWATSSARVEVETLPRHVFWCLAQGNAPSVLGALAVG